MSSSKSSNHRTSFLSQRISNRVTNTANILKFNMLKTSWLETNVTKDVPIAGKLTRTIIKCLNDSNKVPFDHHSIQANLQSKLDCLLIGQSLQLRHRLTDRNRHGQRPNRITLVVMNNHTHTHQVYLQ